MWPGAGGGTEYVGKRTESGERIESMTNKDILKDLFGKDDCGVAMQRMSALDFV